MTPNNKILDELVIAEQWIMAGKKVAIATVVSTWGSAPRPSGSHLVINQDGEFEGSVSGGCVEGSVVTEALDVIVSNQAKMLEFGVADETAWEVGLSCGGKIKVFVTPLEEDLIVTLNASRMAREAAVVVSDLQTGESTLLLGDDRGDASINEHVSDVFRMGKSRMVETADGGVFINAYLPAIRLVVIGAVHISQALASISRVTGFDMEVIDPRTAFATPERFSQTQLDADWPEEVLNKRPLDRWCALVAVTHDPKIDDYPLLAALEADCFYVGALGSRKTHATRLERFSGQGVSAELLARIHAPIGLDIGASSPQEIAVSIMAEIIQNLRAGAKV